MVSRCRSLSSRGTFLFSTTSKNPTRRGGFSSADSPNLSTPVASWSPSPWITRRLGKTVAFDGTGDPLDDEDELLVPGVLSLDELGGDGDLCLRGGSLYCASPSLSKGYSEEVLDTFDAGVGAGVRLLLLGAGDDVEAAGEPGAVFNGTIDLILLLV
jgi:hypothetical protein